MRKFNVLFAALVILAMLLASCQGAKETTPPPEVVPPTEEPTATSQAIIAEEATDTPAPTPEPEKGFGEAPDLAEKVAAGELPPVEERLPQEPVVTTPYESVGKYGGTLNTASWWPEAGNVQLYFAVEAPIKWKADLTGYFSQRLGLRPIGIVRILLDAKKSGLVDCIRPCLDCRQTP